MDNPQQVLLHITSRGEKVRNLSDGAIGRFTNLTKQPVNNINKYGLLHYSVPKTLDLLDAQNRSFAIRITFFDTQSVEIPVILPALDYYNMHLDYSSETPAGQLCFTEILQSSINWAIQKHWTKNKAKFIGPPYVSTRGQSVCNRLGCIVKTTPQKRLQFIFGWRGSPVPKELGAQANGDIWEWYNGADIPTPDPNNIADYIKIQSNSGNPFVTLPDATDFAREFRGVLGTGDVAYNFIDCDGIPHRQVPLATGHQQALEQCQLVQVDFLNLPTRLQFLFGAAGANIGVRTKLQWTWSNGATGARTTEDALISERGRMLLVNYHSAYLGKRSHMIDFTMTIPPNLSAPSFMFLQLTAQGTKSKVLGHNAERGGWAIPTASNQFKSKYDNFPLKLTRSGAYNYSVYDVRQAPALFNLSTYLRGQISMFIGNKAADHAANVRFDQIPYDPLGTVVLQIDPYDPNIQHEFLELHNYSLVTSSTFLVADVNDMGTNHRFGSRIIHYGDLQYQTALAEKAPKSSKQFGYDGVIEAPTFTVSMIDPNWIYTDVPNSTVQSLNILLMWGDTNKNVSDISAYPVQFTLIASQ